MAETTHTGQRRDKFSWTAEFFFDLFPAPSFWWAVFCFWLLSFRPCVRSCTRVRNHVMNDMKLASAPSYKYILYSHMQIHGEHNDTMKTSDTVLRKIYLSLYLKGLRVRGSWRLNRTAIYWPHSYGHQHCVFLVLQGCSTGGPGAHSAGCGLSLPHLVTNGSVSKVTDFLSSPSYIIVQSPTQYLWNGMFDRYQAEITVKQLTSHSLPVHQSMTVPWDFTLSRIVIQARLRDFFS